MGHSAKNFEKPTGIAFQKCFLSKTSTVASERMFVCSLQACDSESVIPYLQKRGNQMVKSERFAIDVK